MLRRDLGDGRRASRARRRIRLRTQGTRVRSLQGRRLEKRRIHAFSTLYRGPPRGHERREPGLPRGEPTHRRNGGLPSDSIQPEEPLRPDWRDKRRSRNLLGRRRSRQRRRSIVVPQKRSRSALPPCPHKYPRDQARCENNRFDGSMRLFDRPNRRVNGSTTSRSLHRVALGRCERCKVYFALV